MGKEEYISSLKVALQGFEEDLVQEILTDYEERFIVGLEQGKTEEQIITDLSSIEELVMELKELQSLDTDSMANWNIGEKKITVEETKESEQTMEQDMAEEQPKENTKQDNNNHWKETASFYDSFEFLMRNVGKVVENVVKKAEEAVEQVEAYMEETKKRFSEETKSAFEGTEKESEGTHSVEQSGESDEFCKKVVIDAGIADVTIRRSEETIVKGVCQYCSYKTAMSYPFYTKQQEDIFYLGE